METITQWVKDDFESYFQEALHNGNVDLDFAFYTIDYFLEHSDIHDEILQHQAYDLLHYCGFLLVEYEHHDFIEVRNYEELKSVIVLDHQYFPIPINVYYLKYFIDNIKTDENPINLTYTISISEKIDKEIRNYKRLKKDWNPVKKEIYSYCIDTLKQSKHYVNYLLADLYGTESLKSPEPELEDKLPSWKNEKSQYKLIIFNALVDNKNFSSDTDFSQFDDIFTGLPVESYNGKPIEIQDHTLSTIVTIFDFLYNNDLIEMATSHKHVKVSLLHACFVDKKGLKYKSKRTDPNGVPPQKHIRLINDVLKPALGGDSVNTNPHI